MRNIRSADTQAQPSVQPDQAVAAGEGLQVLTLHHEQHRTGDVHEEGGRLVLQRRLRRLPRRSPGPGGRSGFQPGGWRCR